MAVATMMIKQLPEQDELKLFGAGFTPMVVEGFLNQFVHKYRRGKAEVWAAYETVTMDYLWIARNPITKEQSPTFTDCTAAITYATVEGW